MALTEILPSEFGFISKMIQAIGGLIAVYIIITLISIFLNRKKEKKLNKALKRIDKIEKNIEEIKNILKKKRR